MEPFLAIFILIIIILVIFYSFLIYINFKINKLELKIINLFEKRTWIIPSIFDVTMKYLNKHDEVFRNILKYRKMEFSQIDHEEKLLRLLHTEQLIHNELNFIFRVSNKHQKLLKQAKFIYLRELIINRSQEIWTLIKVYKNIIKNYNKLIFIKNLTIVWTLIPLSKKEKI